MHGTYVAGILSAKRGGVAPAICPGCTLLVRPIFLDAAPGAGGGTPSATPEDLAAAIIDGVAAGARVLNLSVAVAQPSTKRERDLEEALNRAAPRGVLVAAAAGNQSTLGGTAITRHPWVIPVAACDARGRPSNLSNFGSSIGRWGLSAPGDDVTSLGTDGRPLTLGATSAATPFVSGAAALLWSEFPGASATEVRSALTRSQTVRRTAVVPHLLNAWGAFQAMAAGRRGGGG